MFEDDITQRRKRGSTTSEEIRGAKGQIKGLEGEKV
jgi:hypothetical protein